MFSALRQGSIVYILDKQPSPILKKGMVESVSAPKPKGNGLYGNPLDMVVDIALKTGDNKECFQNIPAGLSTAHDGHIVLSETREAMCAEVESMLAISKQVLESVPYHQKVLEVCETMMGELNPQFAKEREHEAKICALETKIGGIETSIGDMKQMLEKALSK